MHSGYALWKLRVSFQCCALVLSVVVHSLHTLWKCAITQSVHKWKTGLLVQWCSIYYLPAMYTAYHLPAMYSIHHLPAMYSIPPNCYVQYTTYLLRTVLSVKNWTHYGLPTDERTCWVQFTDVLTPICYVQVVKFLEKVIIKWNADHKRPFKCRRNPEAYFREKSNVRLKDPPRQYPAR